MAWYLVKYSYSFAFILRLVDTLFHKLLKLRIDLFLEAIRDSACPTTDIFVSYYLCLSPSSGLKQNLHVCKAGTSDINCNLKVNHQKEYE
jgi:hypothetical protein